MFCRNCGKKIEYEAVICHECAAKRTKDTSIAYLPESDEESFRLMSGFGDALTGAILALFSMLICAASIIIGPVLEKSYDVAFAPIITFIVALVFTLIAFALSLGGIDRFKRSVKAKGAKCIPALVAGIHGIVFTVISGLYLIINFVMIISSFLLN